MIRFFFSIIVFVGSSSVASADILLEYSRVPASFLIEYDRVPTAIKSSGILHDRSYLQRANGFERELMRFEYSRKNRNQSGRLSNLKRLSIGNLSAPQELYGANKFYDLRGGVEAIYDSMRQPIYADTQRERALRYDHSYENPFAVVNRDYHERVRGIWNNRLRAWSRQETRNQAARVVQRADSASLPMKLMRKFRRILGGNDLFSGNEDSDPAITDSRPRNDISVHREEYDRRQRDQYLDQSYGNFAETPKFVGMAPQPKKVKFRSRMNALKRQANVTLENPVFTTGANYDQRARDQVEFKAKRQIPLVEVESTFSYGIKNKTVAMNVYKQLSEAWSCEFNSTQTKDADILQEESVKFNYLFRF